MAYCLFWSTTSRTKEPGYPGKGTGTQKPRKPGSSGFSGPKEEMDCGRKDEREHHRAQNAADDSDGQRFQHGRTSPDAECQRKHAGDGGQRSHGDGPQTAPAGLDHGYFGGKAQVAEAMLGVEAEDAVLSPQS